MKTCDTSGTRAPPLPGLECPPLKFANGSRYPVRGLPVRTPQQSEANSMWPGAVGPPFQL